MSEQINAGEARMRSELKDDTGPRPPSSELEPSYSVLLSQVELNVASVEAWALVRLQRLQNAAPPIHALPQELLVEVFKYIAHFERWGRRLASHHGSPSEVRRGRWRLRRVCARWNETIVTTPLLWAVLDLMDSERNRKLATLYSKKVPLHAIFRSWPYNIRDWLTAEIKNRIYATMPRWRQLSASSWFLDVLKLLNMFDMQHLPALTVLSISGQIASIPSSPLVRLTEFIWKTTNPIYTNSIVDFLAQLPSLVYLSLDLKSIVTVDQEDEDEGGDGEMYADDYYQDLTMVRFPHLPSLRKLHLRSAYGRTIRFILMHIAAAQLDSITAIYDTNADEVDSYTLQLLEYASLAEFDKESVHITVDQQAGTLWVDRGERVTIELRFCNMPLMDQWIEWMESDKLPAIFIRPTTSYELGFDQSEVEPEKVEAFTRHFSRLTHVKLYNCCSPGTGDSDKWTSSSSLLKSLLESSRHFDRKDWLCPHLQDLKIAYCSQHAVRQGELNRMKTLIKDRSGAGGAPGERLVVQVDHVFRNACPSASLVQNEADLGWYKVKP